MTEAQNKNSKKPLNTFETTNFGSTEPRSLLQNLLRTNFASSTGSEAKKRICSPSHLRQQIGAYAIGALALIPSFSNAQSIVSSSGVDLTGDGVTFPTNGNRFGVLSGTHDGVVPTGTVANSATTQYGTRFGGAGQPTGGDAILYSLDGTYDPTTFSLWNDANFNNGQRDGIANFRLRFLDDGGNNLGEESFTAANSSAQQNFTIAGTYNAESFYLIVDSVYTRAPIQFREVQLSGTAIATPIEIDVSSSEGGAIVDGGSDPQGSEPSSIAKTTTYTITNNGTDPLILSGTPTVSGATNISAGPTVSAPGTLTVAPGGTTTFDVTYTPELAGPFSFDLDILSNDPDEGTYDIGVAGTATGTPRLTISSSESGPLAGDFSTDPHGTEFVNVAKTVTYTLSNPGTATTTIDVYTFSASNIVGSATLETPTSFSIAPGTSTTYDVTYTPAAAGNYDFSVDFENNVFNGTDNVFGFYEIEVTGTAVAAEPEIDVSSSEGGAVADGGTDAQSNAPAGTPVTVTYTISNTGTDTLDLPSAPTVSNTTNITGTPTVGALSSNSLAPGEMATFTVTYTPTVAGAFGFDVSVPNNDADEGPYDIAVSGTAAGDADIAVSSSESGAVTDGGTDDQGREPAGVAKTVTYTIGNEGLDTLTLTGTPTITGLVNVADPVVVTAPGSLSLAPGETTTFTVTYTPIAEGPASFDLDIVSNDPDEDVFDLAVSASGNVAPTAVLTGPTGAQSGPFTVTVTFSEPVTGLELTDFVIGNGSPSNLTMTSPGVYTVLVTPTTPGMDVSVSLPANTVMDADSAMNEASNVLTIGSGALTDEEKEVLRDIIVSETVNTLRSDIATNQRAMRAARDRFAAVQRCRVLEDRFENNQIPLERLEAECESDLASRNVPLSFDGMFQATQDSTNVIGSFFGQRTSIDGARNRVISGEFDVTRVEDDERQDETVTASLNGRIAWERLVSEDVLLGYFIGGNASQSEISGSFSGTRTGLGLSSGVYFVDQLDENLFWDGFIAIGAGQNNLELDNGTLDVESDYTTTSAQIGLAVSGVKEFERFEVRPELSVAYGYADIGSVDLEVSTDTSSLTDALEAGDVAFGKISFAPEFFIPVGAQSGQFQTSELRIAPSLSCEYLRTTAETEECGGGLEFEWSASSKDRLTDFSARIGREVIGDQTRDSIGLQFERNF